MQLLKIIACILLYKYQTNVALNAICCCLITVKSHGGSFPFLLVCFPIVLCSDWAYCSNSYAMDTVIHYESQHAKALRAEPNDPESRWWISRGRRIREPRIPAPEANRAASQKPSSPSARIPAPEASHAVDQQKPSTLSPANN